MSRPVLNEEFMPFITAVLCFPILHGNQRESYGRGYFPQTLERRYFSLGMEMEKEMFTKWDVGESYIAEQCGCLVDAWFQQLCL